MEDRFPALIGKFIHHCGCIEFLINNAIKAFSEDSILAGDAVRSSLQKRIVLLKKLLEDRSNLEKPQIAKLCGEIEFLRKKRNSVAHNPVVSNSKENNGKSKILVIRHIDEKAKITEKLSEEELSDLVNKSREIFLRIAKLIPESRNA